MRPSPTKRTLVVPSNRETRLRLFLEAWDGLGDWDELIVVEDNPTCEFDVEADSRYSLAEIEAILGPDAWIISRHDSAIRCFGFLMAVRRGATHILTLDDDCYPRPGAPPIFRAHLAAMASHRRWVPSVPGMRTRGMPYLDQGMMPDVVASMGLWSRIPDLDSVQSLNDLDLATSGRFEPPPGHRLIPKGQYFPLCGMNLCFEARVAPLFYFPLMGVGSPYCRFDDIWAGVISKKILDHLGLSISVGEPFVDHRRASQVMTNLVKEAPGIAANERFWRTIDRTPLEGRTPVECMTDLGWKLKHHVEPYIARLGSALRAWAALFNLPGD